MNKGPIFHLFSAFMLLCYGLKALYFLSSDDPQFALDRYPRLSEVNTYTALAALIALAYWAGTAISYSWFSRRPLTLPPLNFVRTDVLTWSVFIVSAALGIHYLTDQGTSALNRFASGQVFGREFVPGMADDYQSGQLGVRALFDQLRTGIFYFAAIFAIRYKSTVVLLVVSGCFITSAALSSGSRFSLLGSILAVPVSFLAVKNKNFHGSRKTRWCIYFAVFLIPLVAAPLLHMRRGLTLGSYSFDNALGDALVTFDPLDHLVNYLYVLPFEGGVRRAVEELWQFLPRYIFPDKPFFYGMLALQEKVYPGTIGAGTGTYLYGHYPMSNVVMALDLLYGIGLVVHSVTVGFLLSFMDQALLQRKPLGLALFVQGFLTLFHLLRAGATNYMFGMVSTYFLPLILLCTIAAIGSLLIGKPFSRTLGTT